jgi:hypothetical protein
VSNLNFEVIMKTSIVVSMIFLFCLWQNANSQLLPMEDEIRYAPPYDNTINKISPEVEKWMKDELSKSYNSKLIEMKTDVKGRVKDIGLSGNKTEYKAVAEAKQKRKVIISDMHINEVEIEPVHVMYACYTAEKCVYIYNGKEMAEKEFSAVMEKRNKKLNSQKKGKRNLPIFGAISSGDDRSWTALMTAEEISELTKSYKELSIDDYIEPVPSANIENILDKLWISAGNGAWKNGWKGKDVGIYVMEPGCRDTRIPIVEISKYSNRCVGGNSAWAWHHSWVVNVLQYTSPLASIYGFSTDGPYNNASSSEPHPKNPGSYNPSIVIGSHSYQFNFQSQNNKYMFPDANMDNYIYEHGMINFVAAGNKNDNDATSYVTSPGKAVNAITVGAVEPASMKYASYSKWQNSNVGNNKPEVGMYTDLYMGKYSSGYKGDYNNNYTFNGTSASTPLLAGLVADYLHPANRLKGHPEVIKAQLLNGGRNVIEQANKFDTDNNSRAGTFIPDWDDLAWGTTSTISGYWEGYNSNFFVNEEISFYENIVPIVPGKKYRMAISWLSTGSYVYSNGVMPQDLDLYVYQDNVPLAVSTTNNNPYEAVEFYANSSSPLLVKIKRKKNLSPNERIKLGYAFKCEGLYY